MGTSQSVPMDQEPRSSRKKKQTQVEEKEEEIEYEKPQRRAAKTDSNADKKFSKKRKDDRDDDNDDEADVDEEPIQPQRGQRGQTRRLPSLFDEDKRRSTKTRSLFEENTETRKEKNSPPPKTGFFSFLDRSPPSTDKNYENDDNDGNDNDNDDTRPKTPPPKFQSLRYHFDRYANPFDFIEPYTGRDEEDLDPYYPSDNQGLIQPRICIFPDGTKVLSRHDYIITPPPTLDPNQYPNAKPLPPTLTLPDGRRIDLHHDTPLPKATRELQWRLDNDVWGVLEDMKFPNEEWFRKHYPKLGNIRSLNGFMSKIDSEYGGLNLDDPGADLRADRDVALAEWSQEIATAAGATLPDDDTTGSFRKRALTEMEAIAKFQADFGHLPNANIQLAKDLVGQEWPSDLDQIKARTEELRKLFGLGPQKEDYFGTAERLILPVSSGNQVTDIKDIIFNSEKYLLQPFPEYFPVKIHADYKSKSGRNRRRRKGKKELVRGGDNDDDNDGNGDGELKIYSPYSFNFPRMVDFANHLARTDNYRGKIIPYSQVKEHMEKVVQSFTNDITANYKFITRPELVLFNGNETPGARSAYPHDKYMDPQYISEAREKSRKQRNLDLINRNDAHNTATQTIFSGLNPIHPAPNSLATLNQLTNQPTSLHSPAKTLTNPHTLLTAHGLPATSSTGRSTLLTSTPDLDAKVRANEQRNRPTALSITYEPEFNSSLDKPSATRLEKRCGIEMNHYAQCIDMNQGPAGETKCLPQLQLFLQCRRQ